MARTTVARKRVVCEEEQRWRGLVDDPSRLDQTERASAWQALRWAHQHEKITPLPLPVAADASTTSAVLRLVLNLLAAPPVEVGAEERLAVAEWASALRYPPLELMRAALLAEIGRIKDAIGVYESVKSVSSAFPEVPMAAARTILAHAGNDTKLLHKAEVWLLHAEHLSMNGSEESEDEEEWEEDAESAAADMVLDEGAQSRLAEVWTMMACLYARLGDPKKADMYRTRAGNVTEEASSDDSSPEGLEPLEGEMPDPSVLKPADRKLIRQFLESPQFKSLSLSQQKQAAVVLPPFVSLGRLYLGLAPTRLDRYSLEELMLALIPERLVATLEEMAHVPAAIVAWINYLGKNGLLRDAARLVPLVSRLSADFMANCRNPDTWGMAKTVGMQMVASGVDINDPNEVNRFLSSRSSRLLAV